MDDKKKFILTFIRGHSVGVLATSDMKGNPEAAVIEFGSTDDLEIVFDTFVHYRKYQNLVRNGKVALVIGWDDATIQYEGLASELEEGTELDALKEMYFGQVQDAVKFDGLEATRFFKISPSLVRYRDYKTEEGTFFELNF